MAFQLHVIRFTDAPLWLVVCFLQDFSMTLYILRVVSAQTKHGMT